MRRQQTIRIGGCWTQLALVVRKESERRDTSAMAFVPAARHLLRAKDLADARYFEQLAVADMARVAGLSPAHFRDALLAGRQEK